MTRSSKPLTYISHDAHRTLKTRGGSNADPPDVSAVRTPGGVPRELVRAGIDPRHVLIDWGTDDSALTVEVKNCRRRFGEVRRSMARRQRATQPERAGAAARVVG